VIGGEDAGYALWFRPAEVSTVRWAGAPAKVMVTAGDGPRLSPRGSFAEWTEERHNCCTPWTIEELAIAEVVRGALVDVLLELIAARHRTARLDFVRIRSAVEQASDAIAIADVDGHPMYINPAFRSLVGYELADLDDPRRAFGLTDVVRIARQPLAHIVSKREQVQLDVDAIARDGTRIPVSLRVDPIVDDLKSFVGTLYTATDLRPRRALEVERQRLESVLLQRQKLESLGVLAGGIAHDFNNLLTTIVANAALAQESLLPGSDTVENLDAIRRAAEHAALLCRELLAYAGRDHFIVQPLNVGAMLGDLSTLLRTAIGTGCTTYYHIDDRIPLVEADAAQLRQVFMNLIVNASDAIGPKAGRIDVTVRASALERAQLDTFQSGDSLPAGEYVEIGVSDSGCGMSVETMAHVFEPFFSTKFTGRGLGLAAVNGIVRGHRGGLRISSTVGVGTTFTVILPAFLGPALSALVGPTRPRVLGLGRTILLVDDNPVVRDAARRILERSGFAVITADDGVHALAVLADPMHQLAMLISDITMPRMGGLDVLKQLRNSGSLLPVLLISGYSEVESQAQLADDAHTAFVQKPFGIDALMTAVGLLLAPVPVAMEFVR
jgi:PAS domain S-box-containing protein